MTKERKSLNEMQWVNVAEVVKNEPIKRGFVATIDKLTKVKAVARAFEFEIEASGGWFKIYAAILNGRFNRWLHRQNRVTSINNEWQPEMTGFILRVGLFYILANLCFCVYVHTVYVYVRVNVHIHIQYVHIHIQYVYIHIHIQYVHIHVHIQYVHIHIQYVYIHIHIQYVHIHIHIQYVL